MHQLILKSCSFISSKRKSKHLEPLPESDWLMRKGPVEQHGLTQKRGPLSLVVIESSSIKIRTSLSLPDHESRQGRRVWVR